MTPLRLSSRAHLTLGLGLLLLSVMLLAQFAGLAPDRDAAVRSGRVALAESVAISGTALLERNDVQGLQQVLQLVARRNPALRSIGMRSAEGDLVAATGSHTQSWRPRPDGLSTETQIVVPILRQGLPWGSAELHFQPLHEGGLIAGWRGTVWPWIAAVGLGAMVLFYFYLGRMLRHLDPSQSVPHRVRTAFDTLAEGLLVLDPAGRIVLANRAFTAVLGHEADALVGRRADSLAWNDVQGVPLPPAALPWVATLEDGQSRVNVLLSLRDAHGTSRTFMANCSPVPGAAGRPAGVLMSLDDVTELEQKEIELRVARDEAEAANRAKSDFLANMSHEIRTPMNAILGFTAMLRRGYQRDAVESAKYLSIIESSGRHLLALINDILDLSKVEAGHLEVERTDCAAHELVDEVASIMRAKAEEGGIDLRVAFAESMPRFIQSDPARLRQVLTNLVGNALKFTPRGGSVTVGARIQPLQGQPMLVVDVSDTGIGIAEDKLDAIFEPFVQAESSTTRRFGGTGLGLAISRRFARALGGDIVVRSTPGQGSTFTVSVSAGDLQAQAWIDPRQARPAAAGSQGEAKSADWRFDGQRVLVVDDGAENRELVRVVLETAGLAVAEAENGQVALDRLDAARFDLVLMDVQMPVMNGFDATRAIRSRGLAMPVLALTANVMKGFEDELAEAGFSGYLSKPVDIDAMLADLAERLGGRRATQADAPVGTADPASTAPAQADPRDAGHAAVVPAPLDAPASANDAPPASQRPRIESRLANHPRLRKVVRSFCQQLPVKLQAMHAAADAGDLAELAALAHWLKGAGGTVGFDDFFEPARALERDAKDGNMSGIGVQLRTLDELACLIVTPEDARAHDAGVVTT